jgi:hypothetical protein
MREGYEPIAGRRRAVTIAFALLMLINVVAVVLSIADLNMLDRIESGELVGDDEIDAHDTRIAVIGGLQTLAYLACAIVFIRWLRAAYRNLDLLAPGVRRYGHGWAIGAWFVPFLNLWRPKQIINDIWSGSGTPTAYGRPPVLLLAWWLSYVAGSILGRVALNSALDSETIEDLRTADFWYIISDAWDIANALMAISVVRYLTRRMDHRAAVTAEPEAPEAMPTPETEVHAVAATPSGAADTDDRPERPEEPAAPSPAVQPPARSG